MAAPTQSIEPRRASIWLPILGYGFLLFAVYAVAAFLVEQYSGGCMFVIPIFFYALVILLGNLKLQRFGPGWQCCCRSPSWASRWIIMAIGL